jgi:hypothetical protein
MRRRDHVGDDRCRKTHAAESGRNNALGDVSTVQTVQGKEAMLGPLRKFTTEAPKPKKMRKYQESVDQKAVVKWLRARPDWLVERIENAAKRTPSQALRDHAMGMHPGSCDLLVTYKDRMPIRLEMKAVNGVVSDAQKNLHAELTKRKQPWHVAYGAVSAIAYLEAIEAEPAPFFVVETCGQEWEIKREMLQRIR